MPPNGVNLAYCSACRSSYTFSRNRTHAHAHRHSCVQLLSFLFFSLEPTSQPASQTASLIPHFHEMSNWPTAWFQTALALWLLQEGFPLYEDVDELQYILVLLKDKVSHVNMLCSLGSLTNFALTRLLFPLHVMLWARVPADLLELFGSSVSRLSYDFHWSLLFATLCL